MSHLMSRVLGKTMHMLEDTMVGNIPMIHVSCPPTLTCTCTVHTYCQSLIITTKNMHVPKAVPSLGVTEYVTDLAIFLSWMLTLTHLGCCVFHCEDCHVFKPQKHGKVWVQYVEKRRKAWVQGYHKYFKLSQEPIPLYPFKYPLNKSLNLPCDLIT